MILSFLLCCLLFLQGVAGFQQALPGFTTSTRLSPATTLTPTPTSFLLCDQSLTASGRNSRVVATTLWQSSKPEYFVPSQNGETSFPLMTRVASIKATLLSQKLMQAPWLATALETVLPATRQLRDRFIALALQSWWILPMFLAFVPVHCALVHGKCASMPHWWQVVNMDAIRRSQDAALVIGGFLLSNIAYFVSGGFLIQRFPFQKKKVTNANQMTGKMTEAAGRRGRRLVPTRFTMLGLWILLAGVVSTVFHSVQALGSYPIAESLCYLDHGVAISASAYYLDTCGMPSRKVLAIGGAGLVALAVTYPSYAILHSSWHFLSAAAATLWAMEGASPSKA